MTAQFVRLPERLTTGNVTDLDSGWHIGGFDVKPVPDKEENPEAHRFVMDKLRGGHLEEASADEHAVVQDSRKQLTELHLGNLDLGEALHRVGYQEQPLQDHAAATRRQLTKLRKLSAGEAEIPADDTANGDKAAKK